MSGRLTDSERVAAGLSTPSPVLCTGIVDLHHSDGAYDLAAARAGGVVALIHKATEGKDFRDKGFVAAMDAAKIAGVCRGAYHFASASAPGEVQADFFLDVVGDRAELLVLDFETNPGSAGTMDLANALRFVTRVREVTGRWPVFYGYLSMLRNVCTKATPEQRAVLARCPLWLAAYGPDPLTVRVPAAWERWDLMQYTNGSDGPADRARYPRSVPGFARAAQDRSVFRGTEDDLLVFWKLCGREEP